MSRPELTPAPVRPSEHSRRYVGVYLRRNGEQVPLTFAEPIAISTTKTPAWIRKDRRRAASKRSRLARKINRT